MKSLILIATLILVLAGCETTQTSRPEIYTLSEFRSDFSFPETLAGFDRSGLTNYEKDNPGLGYSYRYQGIGTKIDVYVYDFGFKTIPDGIKSEIVMESFNSALSEVFRVGQQGVYQNIEYLGEQDFVSEGIKYAVGRLTYVQEGQARESYVVLTGAKNKILKLRVSFETNDSDSFSDLFSKIMSEISIDVIGVQQVAAGNDR